AKTKRDIGPWQRRRRRRRASLDDDPDREDKRRPVHVDRDRGRERIGQRGREERCGGEAAATCEVLEVEIPGRQQPDQGEHVVQVLEPGPHQQESVPGEGARLAPGGVTRLSLSTPCKAIPRRSPPA